MNVRLFWAVLRDRKRRDGSLQPDLLACDVEGTSLPPVPLGERLAEAIACTNPDPAEAERLRLTWLKDHDGR